MANADYEKLQEDYSSLLERHYSATQSLEAQIEALKAENRKLRDECKGRGYWLIVFAFMLVCFVVFSAMR